jgi:hypothetical protein
MSSGIQLAVAGSILAVVLLFDEGWVRPDFTHPVLFLRIAGLGVASLLALGAALQVIS